MAFEYNGYFYADKGAAFQLIVKNQHKQDS